MNVISSLPTVAVLMATYNGQDWIESQLESILRQRSVNVKVIISDDMSTDSTWSWLQNRALTEPRIILLSRGTKFGRAGANFYRLIADTPPLSADFVAFADQDDIWLDDKLAQHINLLRSTQAAAVSSCVTAFWPDGREAVVGQTQRQRKFDHLFEAAGPGCTYLMTWLLFEEIRSNIGYFQKIERHDWAVYAFVRASGLRWSISSVPSMRYRQHLSNEVGANVGRAAAQARFQLVRSGWYLREVMLISRMCAQVSRDSLYTKLEDVFGGSSFLRKFRLTPVVWGGRRSLRDRCVLLGLLWAGFF